ncbi:related to polyketide synthase required for biosynthesis of fumonisin mycotoxins [Melanopsichium pennsylvanicum]|uniref:Nicotinate phosphoribosyltransferase n=2 Tax=Melanopsichium pennsylvanicum TaxID=63383 RepID=A0AAJ4XH88_9BASI|nr:related to polyketide synthase required for biosynthesis of fumonisin mycotoxins [Melanopsichium pennsylvanicum]
MQQAVLRHYPNTHVAYKFTNRSATSMKFTRSSIHLIQTHIDSLVHLKLTPEERSWLEITCPYLRNDYLDYLEKFRFDPNSQVKVQFFPIGDTSDTHESDTHEWGDLSLSVEGIWADVIFYEVPLMAIVSEVYFSTIDTAWSLEGQYEQAMHKASQLTSHGIRYSEFGTRRRRSYQTHSIVIQGLIAGDQSTSCSSLPPSTPPGKLLGTSNVHFAQQYHLVPIGTVAHEWTMAIAALTGYTHANLHALQLWDSVYSPPDFIPNSPTHDLTIALTDTFSTNVFWADLLTNPAGIEIAKRWRGLRQDSGDSKAFARKALQAYKSIGVDPQSKVIIYSDGLNVDRCIELQAYSKQIGMGAGFGVGTSFTNDFKKLNKDGGNVTKVGEREGEEGEKSDALNIVIKLDSVEGRPVVKISDELTKNTGDPDEVIAVKRRFGIPTTSDAIKNSDGEADVRNYIAINATSNGSEVEDA